MSFLQPILATQVGTTTVGSLLAQSVPYIVGAMTVTSAYSQANLGEAQAKLTEFQSKTMAQASAIRSSERKKDMRKAIGTQLALYSTSGVDVTEGTPVDVMKDTAKEFAYEEFADNFETQQQIYSNMIRARNQRAYGKQQAFNTLLDFGTRFVARG